MNRAPDIAVIDLETTGLRPSESEIVEIAAVILKGKELTRSFSTLVWPGNEAFENDKADRALELQGRTIDNFRGSPDSFQAAEQLVSFLDQDKILSLTSFNVGFDRPFLQREPWSIVDSCNWPFCVMERATGIMGPAGSVFCPWSDYFGSYKWPKLAEAAQFFGVPAKQEELHGALADATIAAKILIKINSGRWDR